MLESPTVAKIALVNMERELDSARTYEHIRKIEASADLLRRLYSDVDEVRVQAERTIVLAWHRIGEELRKQPAAIGTRGQLQGKGPSGAIVVPPGDDAPTLAQQVGSKKLGIRLKRLAETPRETVLETIGSLQSGGKEATVGAVLKTLHTENKSERRRQKLAELSQRTLEAAKELGQGKRYNVILSDPPWRFEPYSRETGMDRAADNHYPTMTNEDIGELDVPAADDCVLFLWATNPMLQEAIGVMNAWGFTYKSNIVWVKDKMGTGYWVREQHELLLIGTKGKIVAPAPGEQFPSVLHAPREEHSRKPFRIFEMIEEMYPGVERLEMFSRAGGTGGSPEGWDFWGAEAEEPAEEAEAAE